MLKLEIFHQDKSLCVYMNANANECNIDIWNVVLNEHNDVKSVNVHHVIVFHAYPSPWI